MRVATNCGSRSSCALPSMQGISSDLNPDAQAILAALSVCGRVTKDETRWHRDLPSLACIIVHMVDLWTPDQLDAIERRYPSREVRALVAEIRRLQAIAAYADDLANALDGSSLTPTPSLLLIALREKLSAPATG